MLEVSTVRGVMSSGGVGPLRCLKSMQPHTRNLIALYASFCWQAVKRCWFYFTAGFVSAHNAKGTKADHVIIVLVWPVNWSDLNPIEKVWQILSGGRWKTLDPIRQMTWRLLSKQPGLPLHPRRRNLCKRKTNQVEMHKSENACQKSDISVSWDDVLWLLGIPDHRTCLWELKSFPQRTFTSCKRLGFFYIAVGKIASLSGLSAFAPMLAQESF